MNYAEKPLLLSVERLVKPMPYFVISLYNTCAISALVVILDGASFPASPLIIPASTSSAMASLAQEFLFYHVEEIQRNTANKKPTQQRSLYFAGMPCLRPEKESIR